MGGMWPLSLEFVAESNELKYLEMCLGTFKEILKCKGVT